MTCKTNKSALMTWGSIKRYTFRYEFSSINPVFCLFCFLAAVETGFLAQPSSHSSSETGFTMSACLNVSQYICLLPHFPMSACLNMSQYICLLPHFTMSACLSMSQNICTATFYSVSMPQCESKHLLTATFYNVSRPQCESIHLSTATF